MRTFWKFEGFYFKYNAVERLLETNRQFIFQRNPLNWPTKFDQKKRSSVKFGKKTNFFSLFLHFYHTTISDWYMSAEGVEKIALEKVIPVSFERNDNCFCISFNMCHHVHEPVQSIQTSKTHQLIHLTIVVLSNIIHTFISHFLFVHPHTLTYSPSHIPSFFLHFLKLQALISSNKYPDPLWIKNTLLLESFLISRWWMRKFRLCNWTMTHSKYSQNL